MQSSTTSVRTSLPPRAFLCADSVTRPLCDAGIGSSVPMYRPLCADRVRFPRHVNCASSHPTQNHPTPRVGGMFYTALEYRCLGPCVPTVSALVCRRCAVSPTLTLGAFCACHWAFVSIGSCVPGQQASESCSRGNASCTRCRAPRHPSGHPSRLPCCMPTVCGFTCHCRWALVCLYGRRRPWAVSPPLIATGRLLSFCGSAFAGHVRFPRH